MHKQKRNVMNGLANTCDGKQQRKTVHAPASHAATNTTPAEFKQDTSQAANTSTRDTTPITSDVNAHPATSSTMESSGFLAAILTANSKEELRILCEERTYLESLQRQNWNTCTDTSELKPLRTVSERMSCLEDEQIKEVQTLRKKRHLLLAMNSQDWVYHGKHRTSDEIRRINRRLFDITGHYGYYVK
jgi:hypothetical protein